MAEKNKQVMIKQLQADRKRLVQFLATLPEHDWCLPDVIGVWSIKDVLAHLAHWEARMPVWLEEARAGKVNSGPEYGLNWDQMTEYNQKIFEVHCDQNLAGVLGFFHAAHDRFMEMVLAMSEAEMMTPGRYRLTGKKALYDWFSQYAAHDRWAKNHIRAWNKARKKN